MKHSTEPDLAQDLADSPRIQRLVQDAAYAHKLYSALCNTDWQPTEVLEILRERTWSVSWRTAGAIVADLRSPAQQEDYLDWYCSGLEGYVHEDIEQDLAELGWVCTHKDTYVGEPIAETDWGTNPGIAGALQSLNFPKAKKHD